MYFQWSEWGVFRPLAARTGRTWRSKRKRWNLSEQLSVTIRAAWETGAPLWVCEEAYHSAPRASVTHSAFIRHRYIWLPLPRQEVFLLPSAVSANSHCQQLSSPPCTRHHFSTCGNAVKEISSWNEVLFPPTISLSLCCKLTWSCNHIARFKVAHFSDGL